MPVKRPMIEVQPTPEQRRAFASHAVLQKPKWRTISPTSFAVPADAFVTLPEELLIGSLVDGHRYVSPVEDAQEGKVPPGELLGVATAEGLAASVDQEMREAVAGESLPDVPESAYAPDSTPLPPPELENTEPDGEQPEGVFPCSGCDREFTTERGRDTHSRMKHSEG
ncbi:hypothetical protein [Streptomyces sp. DH8]|uniref:hypothetical protein n=1 Tax=Streptomyces sp. DH8 TaxID=2857008 RepID=UPI001E56CAEA|nr:hypothetical protein [Streptomyces sp. DH8]